MRSVRRRDWRRYFARLPREIQQVAEERYEMWLRDPSTKSLAFKLMHYREKGRACYEVAITSKYRAVCFKDEDAYVWYWIGTHYAFDRRF